MKASNEFINLRLYSLGQAINMIDCLFDNGYRYKNYSQEDTIRDTVKKDINRMFTGKPVAEKWYYVFYVEIDNEMKDFVVVTKNITIIDARADKIKQIQKKI